MLTQEEINRYSRHVLLPEIGTEGQKKLKHAKVLVVGAGGLGCPVLQYLAAAGVGTIGIADDDSVEESNLQRQILYNTEDIGLPKAHVSKKKLERLNPQIKIISHVLRLNSENALEIINEYDLIVDGSDNFPTRYLTNDACVMLNKPLVFGSIFKFEGQVSVFNYKKGPTYRCLFPEPPTDSPNCAEIGVLGIMPGIIGTFMANEALKIILGIGEILSGKLLVVDALSMQMRILSFEKNPLNTQIEKLIDYTHFCSSSASSSSNETTIPSVSVAQLKKLMESKSDFQLIDVREPFEYAVFNLKGENIPLTVLEKNIHRISRNRKVIIYCKSGIRSQKAIMLLQKKYGYTNLYNLSGGIDAWE
jgi:adenylyltransferase/sulfurtransferase